MHGISMRQHRKVVKSPHWMIAGGQRSQQVGQQRQKRPGISFANFLLTSVTVLNLYLAGLKAGLIQADRSVAVEH